MTTKANTVDWGGLNLVVGSLSIAAKPGSTATASGVDSTEMGYIDGSVAGSVVASKAVVATSAGTVPIKRAVIEDALTVAPTTAQSGGLIILDKLDGVTVTLPATATGLVYDFIVTAASTSVGHIVKTPALSFFVGSFRQVVTATGANTVDTADGTTHNTITLNGTTKGGGIGSKFRITARDATHWVVEGDQISSGSLASAFSAV